MVIQDSRACGELSRAGQGQSFLAEIPILSNEQLHLGVAMKIMTMTDNGGRRTGIERRQFSYALHIPERRSGLDRRKSDDRRSARYSIREQNDRRTGISL